MNEIMLELNVNSRYAKHLYELGVERGSERGRIEVHANTRQQARGIAEQRGFTVKDVNMVG